MLFSNPPEEGAKKSVAMYSLDQGEVQTHSRPKGKIVAKNNHAVICSTFCKMSGNRLAVGYRKKGVGLPDLTVIYQLPDFELVDEIIGMGDEIDVHAATGLIIGDAEDESNLAKFGTGIGSSEPLSLEHVVAMNGHRKWLQNGEGNFPEFVSSVNNWDQIERVNDANDYLLPVFQQLQEHQWPLFRVNHQEKTTSLIHDFDGGIGNLIVDQEHDTIYYSMVRKIGALELETGEIKWELELAPPSDDIIDVFHIYGFDLSPDKTMLAAGGIAIEDYGDHEFVMVDAASGEIVMKAGLCRQINNTPVISRKSSIHAVRWHPAGWCAVGTAAGIVLHVTRDGRWRAYKGAGKGIEALEFINDHQTLLVGSGENQFRTWELLPDELG